MALDVYFRQDIRNALLAAEQASRVALQAVNGRDGEFARGYQEGYQAALVTIALAFGLIQHSDSPCLLNEEPAIFCPLSHPRDHTCG